MRFHIDNIYSYHFIVINPLVYIANNKYFNNQGLCTQSRSVNVVLYLNALLAYFNERTNI